MKFNQRTLNRKEPLEPLEKVRVRTYHLSRRCRNNEKPAHSKTVRKVEKSEGKPSGDERLLFPPTFPIAAALLYTI